MTEKTNWDLIVSSMKRNQGLHKRMDDDKDLAWQKGFTLLDYKSQQPVSDVINVTGNRPVVFADAISADLLSAKWQPVVEGNISPTVGRNVEQFINDAFDQADEYLETEHRMGGGLDAWLSNHVTIRSLLGVRWISQIVDGKYFIDILPFDMRWCAYPSRGLNWVAPMYFSNSDELKELYPSAPNIQALPNSKEYIVLDWWNNNYNEIWVAQGDTYNLDNPPRGQMVLQQPNKFGYPPFSLIFPSVGFMLRDKGYIEHEAESIFWKNRLIYPEINRVLSVQQTLGMNVLFPAFEYEDEEYDSSPSIKPPKPGESKKVKKGGLHKPVPTGDLNRATFSTKEDLYQQAEVGGISSAELGSAGLDRPGVWFARQMEIRRKLEKPRYDAIAAMKAGLARMMVKQYQQAIEGDKEFMVGRTGKKNKFKPSQLGDPEKYSIKYKYLTFSKEMEIINISEAQAARGIVPQRIITRDILQAENPQEWDRELELEKLKALNPAVGFAEMAIRAAEEAEQLEDDVEKALKNWESMIAVHEYVRQMKISMIPPQPPTPEQQRQPKEPKADQTALAGTAKLLGAGGLLGGGQPNMVNNATMRAQEAGNEITQVE